MQPSLLSGSFDPTDTFRFERSLRRRGFTRIAGADEAGRGPLAGPVVAAAVILPAHADPSPYRDSKQTTESQRRRLRELLIESGAAIGLGIVAAATIDSINILQASLLAMREAIADLGGGSQEPDFILVDGPHRLGLATPQEALVKGDARSASIGAASIIAKLARDEIMVALHQRYPHYNFLANKGYPTREHRLAIGRYGPSPEHRRSFRGVKEFVERTDQPR